MVVLEFLSSAASLVWSGFTVLAFVVCVFSREARNAWFTFCSLVFDKVLVHVHYYPGMNHWERVELTPGLITYRRKVLCRCGKVKLTVKDVRP